MLKESISIIDKHLLHIYHVVFALQTYSGHWSSWVIVVLCKPGKPNYGIPKVYRPIALLNTIGKLLTAILTEDMVYFTEKHNLLPTNHFGGRPGRSTTDSIHLVINRIKSAWRQRKVAVMLFLDIEGVFPNAVNDCLLHNLRKRKVPAEYVLFIENMLKNRCTKLKFDDYESNWVPIDNATSKNQTAVTFVDDANLYAKGDTYEEAYNSISNMLLKQGGARDWTTTHNSRFEKSKFAVICFSCHHISDPLRPGKTSPEPHPDFIYEGVNIKPQHSHKFLGVHFDQELRWDIQAEKPIAKAAKWTLLFHRLSKPSTGVHATFM